MTKEFASRAEQRRYEAQTKRSDTPRCDNVASDSYLGECVPYEFAQQLERSNQELISALRDVIPGLRRTPGYKQWIERAEAIIKAAEGS